MRTRHYSNHYSVRLRVEDKHFLSARMQLIIIKWLDQDLLFRIYEQHTPTPTYWSIIWLCSAIWRQKSYLRKKKGKFQKKWVFFFNIYWHLQAWIAVNSCSLWKGIHLVLFGFSRVWTASIRAELILSPWYLRIRPFPNGMGRFRGT